jgi:hypothetical protein
MKPNRQLFSIFIGIIGLWTYPLIRIAYTFVDVVEILII